MGSHGQGGVEVAKSRSAPISWRAIDSWRFSKQCLMQDILFTRIAWINRDSTGESFASLKIRV